MAENKLTTDHPINRLLLASVLVVGLGMIIYFATRSTTPPSNTNLVSAARIAAVTPESYTMISGVITKLDPEAQTITTNFSYIDGAGTSKEKQYLVSVSPATTLQSVVQSDNPPSVATITFANLAVDSRIEAISDMNVAPLDAFTATTILLYTP